MNISYKKNTITKEELENFLTSNEKSFSPNLSKEVYIPDYAQKIYNNAEIFEAYCGNELAGIVCMYANDKKTNMAYITSVIVAPKFRNKKIASSLLKTASDYAEKNGFLNIKLEVSTYNKIAVNLYYNNGFVPQKMYMEKILKYPAGGGKYIVHNTDRGRYAA